MKYRLFRLFLAVGIAAGLPTLLRAQGNGNLERAMLKRQMQQLRQPGMMQQPGAMQQQASEILGTVQAVSKNGIVVADGSNRMWRVALTPVTQVQVTGTATAASLRSGLIVEFTAEIDDHGAVQKKVDSMTITSFSKENPMGVFPAGAADGDDKASGFGDGAAEEMFGKAVKAPKTGNRGGHAPGKTGKITSKVLPAGTYRILGKLIVARGGALTVQAARPPLPFELDDNAAIEVKLSDLSLVRPGHEIAVKALVLPNGLAQAQEVLVKLPDPQAGNEDDQPAKPERKKAAKRPKMGDEANLLGIDGER